MSHWALPIRDSRGRLNPVSPHRKTSKSNEVGRSLVEAAGIEPASEGESFETTTCVVDLLWCSLIRTGSDRQDPDRTSPEGFAGGAGTVTVD